VGSVVQLFSTVNLLKMSNTAALRNTLQKSFMWMRYDNIFRKSRYIFFARKQSNPTVKSIK